MNDELQRIQEQVYYGNINSYTDVLEKVLSESGINRYNPQVKSQLWDSFLNYVIFFYDILEFVISLSCVYACTDSHKIALYFI